MKRFRPRLTYANVIASLALFVALGGSAVAAGLAKNSVGPNQLKKGAVTGESDPQAGRDQRQDRAQGGRPRASSAPTRCCPGNLGAGIISTDKIAASRGDRGKDQEQRRHHQQAEQRRGDVAETGRERASAPTTSPKGR